MTRWTTVKVLFSHRQMNTSIHIENLQLIKSKLHFWFCPWVQPKFSLRLYTTWSDEYSACAQKGEAACFPRRYTHGEKERARRLLTAPEVPPSASARALALCVATMRCSYHTLIDRNKSASLLLAHLRLLFLLRENKRNKKTKLFFSKRWLFCEIKIYFFIKGW